MAVAGQVPVSLDEEFTFGRSLLITAWRISQLRARDACSKPTTFAALGS
ncbi:hypothetical protein QNM97_20240 [Gordonia sp. L191]|nr:hypothetical protein [Gordonia sp. L191]WHU46302.1 hypothetical protein QNM97_20240 [Gordonia sp. L191]